MSYDMLARRPRVIQVIESAVQRGCGLPAGECPLRIDHRHEPIRSVTQYHTLDGMLLAEHDPFPNSELT